jgi:rod shape-determining protein MreB
MVVVARSGLSRRAQTQQLRQVIQEAGGGRVFAADTTALAAYGAGFATDSSQARLILDIGAGTTEASVIVRGTPVVQTQEPVGGKDLVAALQEHTTDKHDLSLDGRRAAEMLKRIGSAVKVSSPETTTIDDSRDNTIDTNEIASVIDEPLKEITAVVRNTLRKSSAALLSDIADSGVVLTGGVGRLYKLDTRLSRRLHVPVVVSDRPQTAVVRGGLKARRYVSLYRQTLRRRRLANPLGL